MTKRFFIILLTVLWPNFDTLASEQTPDVAPTQPLSGLAVAAMPNPKWPLPNVLTGGQPGEVDLVAAQRAGFKTIVNLRPEGEFTSWDEAALVQRLGMTYVVIPIVGEADLTVKNARLLNRLLDTANDGPIMVHCASGNRVGALFALAAREQGADVETALKLGRAAGLTSLEPTVQSQLRHCPFDTSPGQCR